MYVYVFCLCSQEEMLLFMELCVEGSLEALLAANGALQEQMVRRYTKQLTSAIAELHKQGVAHRDIKSGNIFLTNEGHCLKLGDFGCAVKIRANTTARGELVGHVGTQDYNIEGRYMECRNIDNAASKGHYIEWSPHRKAASGFDSDFDRDFDSDFDSDSDSDFDDSRCGAVVSMPACHAKVPGSVPGGVTHKFDIYYFVNLSLVWLGLCRLNHLIVLK
ncbi:protein kinase domain-containing protein [Phthorimaea operculella]|nr:protein kinase domain-containing protein [Phthorimaea operculella]